MRRSELRHIVYAIKVFSVALPVGFLSTALLLFMGVVLLPLQLVSWLLSTRTFMDTSPYRHLVNSHKQIERTLVRFIGNPWIKQ